ncbi:MSHA pilin protein MshA [Nitrincola lacisaponensis]|uniref:Type II secretion system protein H n=1 Tax=Nitrincola lacisaponensis TaxID=267850 RepID=A0A063Y327_9GAMM|nr:GspH/FimT family protein [Nitrincola lacisaponensis]KDE40079.1 MSHA pilin protein MshA [Nitrincola lacisaponensis]
MNDTLCLRHHPRQQGFTLVELILVLVLLGVLTAIVLPRFTQTGFAAYGYTEELASAIRFAQQSAVAANQPITLVFTTGGYRICRGSLCPSDGDFLINPGSGQPWDGSRSGRGQIPAGVTLSPAANLTFDGLGVPSQGLLLQIDDYSLRIEAGTGHVH